MFKKLKKFIRNKILHKNKSETVKNNFPDCPVCFDKITDITVTLNCNHLLCTDCFEKIKNIDKIKCPLCRREFHIKNTNNTNNNTNNTNNNTFTTIINTQTENNYNVADSSASDDLGESTDLNNSDKSTDSDDDSEDTSEDDSEDTSENDSEDTSEDDSEDDSDYSEDYSEDDSDDSDY